MNHIERVFGKARVLLPVIHVRSLEHAARNARTAMENGADGVLLINQGSSGQVTLEAATVLSLHHPTWWVGVNLLGSEDLPLLRQLRSTTLQGLWVDDAGVDVDQELGVGPQVELVEAKGDWKGLYMGGVAFKYQRQVPPSKWGHVAKVAAAMGVDVVVTSGSATGSAAPQEKLAIMREALGDHALALASGVSEENIDRYPMVNAFIVASSLLLPGEGENFSPVKIRRLAERLLA